MTWEAPALESLDIEQTLSATMPGCFETRDSRSGTLIITGGVGDVGCQPVIAS